MIRVMTLATNEQPDQATSRLPQGFAPGGHGAIDILCCQSIHHSLDNDHDLTHRLAHSLGLTCSCLAASRPRQGMDCRQAGGVSGLAILTGSGVWVLNSGSFLVSGDQEGEQRTVQFALVRKNGGSILVVNLELAVTTSSQLVQLRALFLHPLLKEPYGAVVLCADRQTALPGKVVRALANRSNYCPHPGLPAPRPCLDNGMLCLLTAKEQATATVTINRGDGLAAVGECGFPQPGLAIEFEMKRIVQEGKIRPGLPLSFREQWLGNKEQYPAFAA